MEPTTGVNISPEDSERRFGGLRRLFGDASYQRIRRAHIVVVGVGGVGSWAVEALARSGVARLTLIDLDHISESNINRQIQALSSTLGQAKVLALKDRIHQIHPHCDVQCIEEFVEPDNLNALLHLLSAQPDVLIDACDQVKAKVALAAWSLTSKVPCISVGAAGGKQQPQAVEVGDLNAVTHDPLLASVRQKLKRYHQVPKVGPLGIICIFSREAVMRPTQQCETDALQNQLASNLNCQGYGSTVTVTGTFGLVAANVAIQKVVNN
jgi:tRNA threonylcarbamoyladenosine dehydratase